MYNYIYILDGTKPEGEPIKMITPETLMVEVEKTQNLEAIRRAKYLIDLWNVCDMMRSEYGTFQEYIAGYMEHMKQKIGA